MNHAFKLPSIPAWSHWPRDRLIKEQEENARAFARGFQMRAYDDSERMFPSFESCYSHGVVLGEIIRRAWPTFIGVDLAGTKRQGNVIFVTALDPTTQRRYPLEVITGAWTSPDTARHLHDAHSRHANARIIMVENNGYQQALLDWIKHSPIDHSFWHKVEAFTTGMNKNAPQVGLPSLEVEFKNKAWVIPADEFEGHPVTCRCGWCVWTREMKDYPMGVADDTVMGCWFSREAIARWGGVTGRSVSIGDINTR